MFSIVSDSQNLKEQLRESERQNQEMRKQNKALNRKLRYWREQAKELAELRLMRYKIKKDKNRGVISALRRGIS